MSPEAFSSQNWNVRSLRSIPMVVGGMGLERMIFFFKAGLFLHPQWSAFTLTSELTAADERPARSSYLSRFPHYPSTANNGKIASQTDNVSGEQVLYTYDAVNRLLTATATAT